MGLNQKDIQLTSNFLKHYKLRIKGNINLERKYAERVEIFLRNPQSPLLKLHALKGKLKGLYSFSVAGDLRVIFEEYEKFYIFYDIGSHNQVYK